MIYVRMMIVFIEDNIFLHKTIRYHWQRSEGILEHPILFLLFKAFQLLNPLTRGMGTVTMETFLQVPKWNKYRQYFYFGSSDSTELN